MCEPAVLSTPVCSLCHDRVAQPHHWRTVSQEAAHLHDLMWGGGYWLAPPDGYVLPVCGGCGEGRSTS